MFNRTATEALRVSYGPRNKRATKAERLRAEALAKKAELLERARQSAPAFIEYALRNEADGSRLVNTEFHREWHAHLDANPYGVLIAPVEHAKALDLDSELPSPDGWLRLRDAKVGTVLFGRDGQPATVTGLSKIWERQTWRVRFDDGGEVLADAEHRWLAWSQRDLDERCQPRVVTTEQMRESVRTKRGYCWKVPVCSAVEYPAQQLPIHPYVLGAWLGDGDAQGPQFTCHERDREILDRCVQLEGGVHGKERRQGSAVLRLGIGVSVHTKRSPQALSNRLKALGVVNNKHIPANYLVGSVEQRRELLAGLLDTDGTVTRGRGGGSVVSFSSSDQRLALQVLELVRSLGFKATVIAGQTPKKTNYRVNFTARVPVFRLARKLARQQLDGNVTRTRHRSVVAIEPGPVKLVRCLTVASPDHTFLVGRDYTVTHNTQQISVGRVLWRLGQDPTRTIALIQGTEKMAQKTLGQIRSLIERNQQVREVFPGLRRSAVKGEPWTQGQITVQRPTVAKDPSIQARGVFGDVVGSRLTDIVLDDVLTFENTRTAEQRKKLIEWFDTTVFTRLLPGGVIWVIGTPWHPEDLLHELSKRPGFAARRYSAVRNPDDPPTRWEPMWHEQWSLARLESRRANMPEGTFVRKYLCRVRLDSTSRFRKVWLDRMCQLGVGRTFYAEQPKAYHRGPPLLCFTGVDLAIGDTDDSAQTCLFTIALMPDGRRLVVDIESGRWQAPEILDRIYSVHRRYKGEVHVESNAAQKFLVQIANGQIPVTAHHTGRNKWDAEFGVESLAVEIRNGQWIMPSGLSGEAVPEEGKAFISECLHFNPEEHTGDRLMAAWIAREALRKFGSPRTGQIDTLRR